MSLLQHIDDIKSGLAFSDLGKILLRHKTEIIIDIHDDDRYDFGVYDEDDEFKVDTYESFWRRANWGLKKDRLGPIDSKWAQEKQDEIDRWYNDTQRDQSYDDYFDHWNEFTEDFSDWFLKYKIQFDIRRSGIKIIDNSNDSPLVIKRLNLPTKKRPLIENFASYMQIRIDKGMKPYIMGWSARVGPQKIFIE